MCMCNASACGAAVANLMYSTQKLASCCAAAAVVATLILTLIVMLGVGVGLGYHYCVVETKTYKLDLQEFRERYTQTGSKSEVRQGETTGEPSNAPANKPAKEPVHEQVNEQDNGEENEVAKNNDLDKEQLNEEANDDDTTRRNERAGDLTRRRYRRGKEFKTYRPDPTIIIPVNSNLDISALITKIRGLHKNITMRFVV